MLFFRNKCVSIGVVISMKGEKNPILGAKIKQLRKERGYTQSTFADALRSKYGLRTDRAVVGKWEIGYQTPEIYTTKCIAELLGVSLDYLTSDKENILDKNTLTEDEKLLLKLFRSIPEDKKQIAIEMLKAALQTK